MKLDVRVEHPISLYASFEIRGFTALLGRSGAGKTTLLKALAGLIPATGTPGDGRPPEARRVGYLPQTAALFPHLTALENTAYALRGVDRFAQARRMLDALDLGDLAARPAAGLSGGQAQRIALARALAGNAQLLLLDEPSAALDATTRNATLTWLIDTITARQLPALAATHDPAVAGLADWVVLLSGRQIIQQGHPRDILSAPASKAAAELLGYENIWDEAAIRAADVEIAADGMPATILSVREHGAGLHIRCTAEMPVTIHLRAGDRADYSPGAKICLQFPGDKLKRFKNTDVLF